MMGSVQPRESGAPKNDTKAETKALHDLEEGRKIRPRELGVSNRGALPSTQTQALATLVEQAEGHGPWTERRGCPGHLRAPEHPASPLQPPLHHRAQGHISQNPSPHLPPG